jgi:hypothetical protein
MWELSHHFSINISMISLFISDGFNWSDVWTVLIPRPSTKSRLPQLTSTGEQELWNTVRLHSPLLPNKSLALSCNVSPQVYANEGALIFTMLIQSFQKSYLWAHNFMLWLYCMQMRTMFCYFPFLQKLSISSTNRNITTLHCCYPV